MDTDSRKTIVLVGVFGFLGTLVMATRLTARKMRCQKFNYSDYLTMAAIVCLMARTALTTVVELWGNNNLTEAYRAANQFTPADVYQRGIGSKLTIANRIIYNTYIWIQKAVVLLLCRQVLSGLPWPQRIIKIYCVVLVVTYMASQAATFVDCNPLYLYWQVVPDPGACPRAPLQLIIFISLNIATDVMLIIFPMPWLIRMKRPLKERLQLMALFSIGFLVIAIAFVRLPINWGGNNTTQIYRNVWGSVEAFAAALVANVPTLFALRRQPNSQSRPASYSMPNNVRSSVLKQNKDDVIYVTRSIELEHKLGGTTSNELRLPRHYESWERRDSLP